MIVHYLIEVRGREDDLNPWEQCDQDLDTGSLPYTVVREPEIPADRFRLDGCRRYL